MSATATMEEFEALLNESLELETPGEGEVVKGTVLAIEAGQAIIDIGYKMEGRVELKEFAKPGHDPEIAVGDTVEVFLERVENARGEAVISREKARREEAWDRLEKANDKGERVEGAIFGRVKGGFTVDLGGAVAFLPGSQVDVRPVRDAGPVSRRAILEESRAEQRAEIVGQLAEGQTVEGVVKNITSEILEIGQKVDVQVVKINKETQRISLGMKQLQSDPWDAVEGKYPLESRHTGRVTNITDYGAFVELAIRGRTSPRSSQLAPRLKVKLRTSPSSVCLSVSTATSTAWFTCPIWTGTAPVRKPWRTTRRATWSKLSSPMWTPRKSVSPCRSKHLKAIHSSVRQTVSSAVRL